MKLPCTVDGLNGEESISSFFAGKYKDLYNSVFYNVSDMDALRCWTVQLKTILSVSARMVYVIVTILLM